MGPASSPITAGESQSSRALAAEAAANAASPAVSQGSRFGYVIAEIDRLLPVAHATLQASHVCTHVRDRVSAR